jgi:hypothetical protein
MSSRPGIRRVCGNQEKGKPVMANIQIGSITNSVGVAIGGGEVVFVVNDKTVVIGSDDAEEEDD